eukprot:SAG11_NODE_939_length_6468_cov_4.629926_1_plen_137_part_00
MYDSGAPTRAQYIQYLLYSIYYEIFVTSRYELEQFYSVYIEGALYNCHFRQLVASVSWVRVVYSFLGRVRYLEVLECEYGLLEVSYYAGYAPSFHMIWSNCTYVHVVHAVQGWVLEVSEINYILCNNSWSVGAHEL